MSQSPDQKPNQPSGSSSRRDFIKKAGVAGMIAAGAGQHAVGQDAADTAGKESGHGPAPGTRLKPNIWTYVDKAHKFEFPSGDPQATEIWMYTDRMSYRPGDEAVFYVHTTEPNYDVRIERDGNVARFGGNSLWQIRLEDDGKTQVNYKHAAADPLYKTDNKRLVASLWGHPVVNRPIAATFGLTGVGGIYAAHGGAAPRSSGGYIVYRPRHRALEGTDLYFGDQFGQDQRIVAFEVDGLDYTFRDGLPYPSYRDGAHETTEILALVPAIKGEEDHSAGGLKGRLMNAPLEEFEGIARDSEEDWQSYFAQAKNEIPPETEAGKGVLSHYGCSAVVALKYVKGEVFNAGTATWVHGLLRDDFFTQQITRNVLNRFTRRA